MNARYDNDDDWDEEYDDLDTADDAPTRPCPYCRGQIHEDAQRCPYCEQYISDEDSGPAPKPWWLYFGVAVCFLIVCLWIWYSR